MGKIAFYRQLNSMDCGPSCIRMVAKYFGRHYNSIRLSSQTGMNKNGVSLWALSKTAEDIGFKTRAVEVSIDQLAKLPLPCILHWNDNHFVVLYSISKFSRRYTVADPSAGILTFTKKEIEHFWNKGDKDNTDRDGIALLLQPTDQFYSMPGDPEERLTWEVIFKHLKIARKKIIFLLFTLLLTTGIQFAIPYFTKRIVDRGISAKDLNYVSVVIIALVALFVGRAVSEFLRGRLLLFISNHVNLSIVTDFWMKLAKLPLSYFDTHPSGDTLQRINDINQVQTFLTGQGIQVAISILNFIVFGVVLTFFDSQLALVFAAGIIFHFSWIYLFQNARQKINYEMFHISAKTNNATLELVQSMQELRLNNAEKFRLKKWRLLQEDLFKLKKEFLALAQYQQSGGSLLSQVRDVIIIFLVAKFVIDGTLGLGSMVAIMYILGQLGAPIEQLVLFIQGFQDANISIARLNEVHDMKAEEKGAHTRQSLPVGRTIELINVSYAYSGFEGTPVLQNINLTIPEGKITAIVGLSGSGKTTLLKLLLRYYENYHGDIIVGDTNLNELSPSAWRSKIGVVLQDGKIFNDTLVANITLEDSSINYPRFHECCRLVNITSFSESLPNGIFTRLGAEGLELSAGQKQRILIARALYKNPDYLILDEATNALDAENEKLILQNLNEFLISRTVIVVAHRLSTVRSADKIVVIDNGQIAEQGSHKKLSSLKGRYFNLVKDQLELEMAPGK